jgi:hypothetical protein
MANPTNQKTPNMAMTITDPRRACRTAFSDVGADCRVVVKSAATDSTMVTAWTERASSVAPSRRRRVARVHSQTVISDV